MALGTVFVAMIEPWLTRTRFSKRELALGLMVLPGVVLVVGGVPAGMRAGIAVGAVSALLVALFGSLNKRLVEHGDPLTVTALELGAGTLMLTLLAPLMPMLFPAFAGDLLVVPGGRDFALLLGLALACTLLPFTLSLVALRHMSAFAQQLAVNLEPVYAIVLAALLLGEQHELTALFYVGVVDHPGGGVHPPAAGLAAAAAASGSAGHRRGQGRRRVARPGPFRPVAVARRVFMAG